MAINTNLNVDPYFDDFDETKQYNRILFKPARAVQARELTQLQTILQNQVERFGSNIYKEGTVISGVNYTERRDDLFYVKLNDQSNFTKPSEYDQTDEKSYFLEGQSSGLRAVIVKGENGFLTSDPDLKTFFINYLNTGATDKQFIAGEQIEVQNADGSPVLVGDTENPLVVTAANVSNHVGRSFGVTVSDGVIFRKGFFIFVEKQTIIVSKYDVNPKDVSVGFAVNEFIINSDDDSTLLDNARGYNNENAPGADRLQLKPQLVVHPTNSEPEEFFAIARYIEGEAVRIRDVTEFNSIANEMARRTYEESGDYVVRGMNVTLEKDTDTFAVVSPGKAYVQGYEVESNVNRYLNLDVSDETQTKTNVSIGVEYGNYFEFVWNSFGVDNNVVLDSFTLDGTRYNLYNSSNNVIGTCSVKNVEPPVGDTGLGKIYVYAIEKNSGQENTPVSRIGNTPVYDRIKGVSVSPMIFNIGKQNIKDITNNVVVERIRESVTPTANTVTIQADDVNGKYPISNDRIFAVDNTNNLVSTVSVTTETNGDLTVVFDADDAAFVYYDQRDASDTDGTSQDALQQLDIYVQSTVSNGIAYIGVPNALKILEIVDNSGSGNDVTSKFKLVKNQKDDFYDISYVQLKSGQTLTNSNLRIKATVLKRTGNGYLNSDSYDTVTRELVNAYSGKNGRSYDLLSSYDFRPYVTPLVTYETVAGSAPTVSSSAKSFQTTTAFSNFANIELDFEYYMSRIDSVVVSTSGRFSIVKGSPNETPSIPVVKDGMVLSNIFVPGGDIRLTGPNRAVAKKTSTKNYTMKDIENIDKQLYRLTENVSLSLLNLDAKDIFIPDANGLDRFKNGILVDQFKDFNVANVTDPEFNSSIDRSKKILAPSILQYPVDMKYHAGTNITKHEDVITISDSGEESVLISQPFATNTRSLTSDFYLYNGVARISPEFDLSYDTVTNPAVNIDVDFAGFGNELLDAIQEFVPLTSSSSVEREVTREINSDFITTTTDVITTSTGLEVVSNENPDIQSIGNFLTDFAFSPYVSSREVKILVSGLRPNTRHYFYFDETPVDANVYPGTYTSNDVNSVSISGALNGEVKTDSNGTLAAVFVIPENTFFVGENILEIKDSNDVNVSETSYAKISYQAYSFDVGRTELNTTTRPATFETVSNVTTTRNVASVRRDNDNDPLSQTFFVKRNMAEGGSNVFVKEIDVYFNTKSETNGVNLEIREVINGYPSNRVVPFGRKRLTPNDINLSDNGTTSTTFVFDNPVKLNVEKEYALVLKPDANDPNYTVFISKVGNVDLSTDQSITQDRFDGVLFTSTNDRSWKSYQDEDLKFTIRKIKFGTTSSTVDLIPNDVEIFSLNSVVNPFKSDEIVYTLKGTTQTATTSGRTATLGDNTLGFAVNDYAVVTKNSDTFVGRIINIDESTPSQVILTFDSEVVLGTGAGTTNIQLAVGGRVQYFNSTRSQINLKGSSARSGAKFETGDTINGYRSGATATINTIDERTVSYMQPFVSVDNDSNSSASMVLMNTTNVIRPIAFNDNAYLTNNVMKIVSKSLTIDDANKNVDEFKIRTTMTNNGFSSTSPILDDDLSLVQVYEYRIDDDATLSSSYVSKEIVLDQDMDAVGLKVLLSAYRPVGTTIDVYARFVYPTNAGNQTDWIQLDNANPETYSNITNVRDYRELEYDLDEVANTNEFTSFQLKITLKHSSSEYDINTFAHVNDYRAIALT